MANPFGAVVDNFKLDEYSVYVGKVKTQEDRAREAVALENDQQKYSRALSYVRELKAEWGNGTVTHVLIYNATGDALRFIDFRERGGYTSRTPFPMVIGNGQWVTFLHVEFNNRGSVAILVYRGKNASGNNRDFCIAWRTRKTFDNTVLNDVGPVNSFTQPRFNEIFEALSNNSSQRHTLNKDGVRIEADISAADVDPFYRVILSTPFGPRPPR